jgi:hypothetical protein
VGDNDRMILDVSFAPKSQLMNPSQAANPLLAIGGKVVSTKGRFIDGREPGTWQNPAADQKTPALIAVDAIFAELVETDEPNGMRHGSLPQKAPNRMPCG